MSQIAEIPSPPAPKQRKSEKPPKPRRVLCPTYRGFGLHNDISQENDVRGLAVCDRCDGLGVVDLP